MSHRNPSSVVSALAAACLTCVPLAPRSATATPCRPLAKGARVRVDLADAPLRKVARAVSCWTGSNVVVGPALAGQKVRFVAARPVARRDLLPLLDAALRLHGLVLERRKGHHVIDQATPARAAQAGVLRLRHVPAEAAATALERIAGVRATPAGAMALAVHGDAATVARAKRWLAWIDAPGGHRKIALVRVRTRPAAELAPLLEQALGRRARGLRVVADARSGRLIVLCRAEDWPLVRRAIARLDRRPAG